MSLSSRPVRRCFVVVMALLVSACSSGSDAATSTVAQSSADAPDPTEPLFDPNNPDGTEAPVLVTEVELDDDVIIATDDGSVPTPTTNPPVDPDGPDVPPEDDVLSTTTVPPVPLPEPAAVQRIVSMSPTHTETLFALGLGDWVVAVDSESDYPAEVESVRQPDLDTSSSDIAPLLAFDPDVVLIGDDPTGLAGRLNAAGVATYSGPMPETLDAALAQMQDIADVVGLPDRGEELVASIRSEIAEIVASLPSGERTYFHEIDPSLVTITPGGFLDSVYGQVGLVSIVADAAPGGFVQVGSDDVVSANPDVLLLADAECCAVTIDRVAERPGWGSLSVVSSGAVVEVPDALWMRWGPRVVELVRLAAGGVAAAG